MNLFGQHVILTDTAGLRAQTSDAIEREGIAMAKEESKSSHTVLAVIDVTELRMDDGVLRLGWDAVAVDELLEAVDNPIVLLNKSDLLPGNHGYHSTEQKVLLRSGKTVDASLISLKSQHTDETLGIIQAKLKSVLQSKGLSRSLKDD